MQSNEFASLTNRTNLADDGLTIVPAAEQSLPALETGLR